MCGGRDFRDARASRSIHVLQDLENDAVGQIDDALHHAVQQNERPAVPKTWRPELVELLGTAWAPDQETRCTAGYAAGVLSRVETMYAQADPLAGAETPGCACTVS